MARKANIVLMLAGDVMTGRGIDQILHDPGAPALHESYIHDARDYVRMAEKVNGAIPRLAAADYVWGDALPEIERVAPDLCIVNLETAVTTSTQAWPGKGIHYRMNPANVDCLKAAHIDCCSMANNHVLDWGRPGLNETLQVLEQAGLHAAGAGMDGSDAWAPVALPLNSHARLLVFGCATASSGVPAAWAAAPMQSGVALLPDLSESTARLLAEDIERRRSVGDMVLLSIHWGDNWSPEVPAAHREFAHRMIDLGVVDIIHGHSAHHPMPVEVYHNKLILYGCGDLVNDYEGIGAHQGPRSDVACLYFATFSLSSRRLQGLDLIPLQRKRFRLVAANLSASETLKRNFQTDGYRLEPLPTPRKLRGWSLRWKDTV